MTSQNMGRKRKAVDLSTTQVGKDQDTYTITWPADLTARKKKAKEDIYYDKDDPGDEALSIQYAIEPGSQWERLKPYKKMKYQDIEFQAGDCVYVNRQLMPPEPPSEDATDDEILNYRKTNMWVGRIQQVKALEANEVFVRVFWLYWPEELPTTKGRSGRDPWHGKHEMVLSNHPDIIDATTISGSAKVAFWNEHDENITDVAPDAEIYYRSTLNYAKDGKPVRSQVRKHCICNSEHNPDKPMFRCNNDTCGMWNHEQCLKDKLLKDLAKQLPSNNTRAYLDQRADEWLQSNKTQTVGELIAVGADKLTKTVKNVMHQIEGVEITRKPSDEFDAVAALTPSKKKPKQDASSTTAKAAQETPSKASSKSPLKSGGQEHLTKLTKMGQFNITIKQEGKKGSVVAVVIIVPGNKATAAPNEKWELRMDCLRCHKPLD